MKFFRLAVLPAILMTLALLPSAANARTTAGVVVGYRWGTDGGPKRNTSTTDQPVRVTIPDPGATVVQVATSQSDEYYLMSDGTVWVAGDNQYGQLGNGKTGAGSLNKAVEVHFPAGTFITALPTDVMPWNTALAVDSTGQAWGWGANNTGQLCLGDKVARPTPAPLPLPGLVTSLAGAGDHVIYIAGGSVYACGAAEDGQLGDGNTKQAHLSPVLVDLPVGEIPVSATASFRNGGILTASGDYYDWGLNTSGQVGDGRISTDVAAPALVSLPAPVSQVSLGGGRPWDGQTAVQLTDGSWWVWGNNAWGQLGDGGTAPQPAPEPLSAPAGTVKVVSGGETLYAVTEAGEVYAWGNGAMGQLGDSQMGTSPAPALALAGVQQLEATANNVAAAP
jgi:alpha-tubulin suppressor-like RCC1 family protein